MPNIPDAAASIAAQATRRSRATALVWRNEEISYGELWAAAQVAQDRIGTLGLAADEPVCVQAAKDPASIALVLGALASGQPFLLPSAGLPAALRQALVADAGCRWTISPDSVDRAGPTRPQGERPPPGTGVMLATSGSTGLPKIVPLPVAGLVRFTEWAAQRFEIGPGTPVLSHAPLSFDISLLDVWTTLSVGGVAVLVEATEALRGTRIAEMIERWHVQVVQAVPMLHALLAKTGRELGHVRHVVSTGDTLSPDGVRALTATYPNARWYDLYGCTETNDSLLNELDPVPDDERSLGDPLPGVQTAVIGPGGTVRDGAARGELWVRTPFQSDGYLGSARHNGRFTPAPHDSDGPPWFRTGDLVRRRAPGRLVLLGRDDFRVKVRGVGVDLAQVERTLLAHPAVSEALVLALPDGLSGRRLAAVAVRSPCGDLDSLRLRRHCAGALPREAVPYDLLITDSALPRTANGKVDRAAVAHHQFGADPLGVRQQEEM